MKEMSNQQKPVIGLVGGVGSGKSTVARELGELGCEVIDCDSIGHELLRRHDIRDAIISRWPDAADPSGQISRPALSDIVFADKDQLAHLNDLMHPIIRKKVEEIIRQGQQNSSITAFVVDAPALIEAHWQNMCNLLVFVESSEPVRLKRTAAERSWGPAELRRRENSQISIDTKAKLCSSTLSNNSSLLALREQTRLLFRRIMGQKT